jgi:hypothetical protein
MRLAKAIHPFPYQKKLISITERETWQTVAPITVAVNEVGQIQVQLSNGHVYVVRVHAEPWLCALRVLLQPLPVCTLKGDRFEKDHHYQVQPPHLEKIVLDIVL